MDKSKETISLQLRSYCNTLETVTKKQIDSTVKEQAEIAQKMKLLIEEFQKVSEGMPKEDISEGVARLSKICDRLENCRSRVRDVIRRADKMSADIDKPPVKIGNLIDIPIGLVEKTLVSV